MRLRNTRSFRNSHRKKCVTVRSGDRAGQAMSPKLRTQVTRCCAFQRSIATDHMKLRPLLYRPPSRQPRQANAPAQYSNLKCVSRLSATLYIYIYIYIYIYSYSYSHLHTYLLTYLRRRDSSVGIATRYGMNIPGIESRWGSEIFRTCPDRL